MALPKENRLTQKRDFDIIFKEGKIIKGNFLFVKYKKSDFCNSRFAFSISIKIAGNAVTKNKLKRSLSELIRQNIQKIQNNYDVVIVVKKKEKDNILGPELLSLLTKTNILK